MMNKLINNNNVTIEAKEERLVKQASNILKNLSRPIIDAHSHFGEDKYFQLNGNPNEYVKVAEKVGVGQSLITPCPTPVYRVDDICYIPSLWFFRKGKIRHYDAVIRDGVTEYNKNFAGDNPYEVINIRLRKQIERIKSNVKLHFVPLIHPLLDNSKYIESLLEQGVKAFKVSGVGAGLDPKDIKPGIFKKIRSSGKPLIVDTDCSREDDGTDLYTVRNWNTAQNWIKVLRKYEIPTLLTHGARLCKNSIKEINNDDLFILGMGPDLLMNEEKLRLHTDEEYLDTLLNTVHYEKLVFDLDYPWNIKSRNDLTLETDSVKRLEAQIKDENVLSKILYENSLNFFSLTPSIQKACK